MEIIQNELDRKSISGTGSRTKKKKEELIKDEPEIVD